MSSSKIIYKCVKLLDNIAQLKCSGAPDFFKSNKEPKRMLDLTLTRQITSFIYYHLLSMIKIVTKVCIETQSTQSSALTASALLE